MSSFHDTSDGDCTGRRLRDLLNSLDDPEAWRRFVDRYGKKVLLWRRRWGLQQADAENVTQEVLTKLAGRLNTYDPAEGRFRPWLKTVAHHAWCDYLESQRRPGGGTGDSVVLEKIQSLQARDDLASTLEGAFDSC